MVCKTESKDGTFTITCTRGANKKKWVDPKVKAYAEALIEQRKLKNDK